VYLKFHIEHIVAQQHLLDDSIQNLALACRDCNCQKGPNLTSIDPATREINRLFNPRLDRWEDHFEARGALIVGRTAVGEVTSRLLHFNAVERVRMRHELIENGEFPS